MNPAVDAVLDRMRDPETVRKHAAALRNTLPYHGLSTWNPASLAHGHPGVALLAAEAAAHDRSWLPVAHAHIEAGLAGTRTVPATGLHCGPASVLAAVVAARRAGAGYHRLHERLVRWVSDDVLRRCAEETNRMASGPGVPWHGYDIVAGMAGLTRLLLLVVADDPSDERAREAAGAGLSHLVAVLGPVEVKGREVPGWWVPSHLQPAEEDQRAYPDGDFNAGFAHGPAGPLAVLAAAERQGMSPDGARERAEQVAEWLRARALRDEAGPYWPCRISWQDELNGAAHPHAPARTAWCYGAPGVALALDAAGRAFGRPEWSALAAESMAAVFARPRERWLVEGPTVCHGTAGILAAAQRLGPPEAAKALAAELTAAHDVMAPFGYRHLVPASPTADRDGTMLALDVAGTLEGAAGVAHVLLSEGRGGVLDALVFAG